MAAKVGIQEITPTEALKLLEKNTGNRNVRQGRVEMYAADMKAGNWKLNGAPIIVNGTGAVLDGQHRLLACVMANKPFTTTVVSGVTNEAHKTIDTGLGRTMSDELRWQGEEHTAALAATLNLLWKLDDDSLTEPYPVASRAALSAYLKANPEVRRSVQMSQSQDARATKIRTTALAAVHYMLLREHGVEIADRFVDRVSAGTDYTRFDPCLTLRNYALSVAGNRALRPSSAHWLAVIVKAANAWLQGSEIKNLRWRRIGPGREGFPVLLTREDVGDLAGEEL